MTHAASQPHTPMLNPQPMLAQSSGLGVVVVDVDTPAAAALVEIVTGGSLASPMSTGDGVVVVDGTTATDVGTVVTGRTHSAVSVASPACTVKPPPHTLLATERRARSAWSADAWKMRPTDNICTPHTGKGAAAVAVARSVSAVNCSCTSRATLCTKTSRSVEVAKSCRHCPQK